MSLSPAPARSRPHTERGWRRRWAATAAAAAVLASGLVATSPASATNTPVTTVLAALTVQAENTSTYDRDYFNHWITRDGCDTRARVLKAESLTATTQNSNCTVQTGRWLSYYDGVTWTAASDVDIDHMVPLSEAWDSGAHLWTAAQREAFANDLAYGPTLVAVTDNVNQSKGDKDPAEWMPPSSSAYCRYVTEWVGVKYRWNLSVDTAERDKIKDVLNTQCEGATMALPAKAGTPGGGTVPPPAPPARPDTPFTQLAAHPDFTGDQLGDLFGVDQAGRLWLYPGAGAGRLGSSRSYGFGWGAMDVYAPGDWNGDGHGDLVAVNPDGVLYLYAGTGTGGLRSKVKIGHGWTGYRIVPAGDIDNNGTADLLGIDPANLLWLYPGDGRGGFGRRVQVGNGWGGFNLYAAGDMNLDGLADILSIDNAGQLWYYSGRGRGYFNQKIQVGYGWTGYEFASGADFNGNGVQDLMGRDPEGRLWFYSGRTAGTFAMKVQVGKGW